MSAPRRKQGRGDLVPAAALAALALVGAGCSRPEPLRIGFVAGLSGRVADLGISARDGATLAAEERNRAGGVNGRPAELIVRSDEQDPEVARAVDRELAALGVVAIVGHATSAMSVAALPVANELGVPLVSPTTTTTELAGIDDQFLRVASTTRAYASHVAESLRRNRQVGSAAVIFDLGNRAYTEDWYRNFRERFEELGGTVASVSTFHSGTEIPFEALAREATDSGAESVVLIASAMDSAMLAQQVRKLGSPVLLAGSEWASTEQLLDLGGAAVEGMVVSQFFDRESTLPGYVAFRERFRERFGRDPGFAAVGAYDATNIVLEAAAARRAGEDLRDAILRIRTFPGVQGPVTLDRFGDTERRNHIAVVRDGAFAVLE